MVETKYVMTENRYAGGKRKQNNKVGSLQVDRPFELSALVPVYDDNYEELRASCIAGCLHTTEIPNVPGLK